MGLMENHFMMSLHIFLDHIIDEWVFADLCRTSSTSGLDFYRDAFDRMSDDQITWMPYTAQMLEELPPTGREHYAIWRARVSLICFDIVELHLPGRVMRQFGYEQVIPAPVNTFVDLHKLDRRGKPTEDWSLRHARYLAIWDRRAGIVVTGTSTFVPSVYAEYMRWYYNITRVFVSLSFRLPTHHCNPNSMALHLTMSVLIIIKV
ncbi:unnamed protein product, partial [Cuscuta europaea]